MGGGEEAGPTLFVQLTFASAASNRSTASMWPLKEATWRGDTPVCDHTGMTMSSCEGAAFGQDTKTARNMSANPLTGSAG